MTPGSDPLDATFQKNDTCSVSICLLGRHTVRHFWRTLQIFWRWKNHCNCAFKWKSLDLSIARSGRCRFSQGIYTIFIISQDWALGIAAWTCSACLRHCALSIGNPRSRFYRDGGRDWVRKWVFMHRFINSKKGINHVGFTRWTMSTNRVFGLDGRDYGTSGISCDFFLEIHKKDYYFWSLFSLLWTF